MTETQMLFPESGGRDTTVRRRLAQLPISVIDVGLEKGVRTRRDENHAGTSSRRNYSNFPVEVASLCCELFLRDSGLVFDPFSGWGERARACADNGLKYVGYDINQRAVDSAISVYGVSPDSVYCRDSLLSSPPSDFDALFTCPPYWNLEKYTERGLDAEPTWPGFLAKYTNILTKCVQWARPRAVFCIVTGDWRSKSVYYDLTGETWGIMKRLGATVLDTVVLNRAKSTKIKIMIPQAVANGYTVKVHETLQVFVR